MPKVIAPIVVSRYDFTESRNVDTDADMSYLGSYSGTLENGGIDRGERGDMGRNEFRYFNPGCGDAEYIEKDYERMEAYNRGAWGMISIRAEVEIEVDGTIQTIQTPGLCGVEGDSGKEYLASIYAEQCDELESILESMGFTIED